MRIGMIGLGRMGASMAQRLMLDGHECVAFDREPQKVNALVEKGAVGAPTLEELIAWLPAPRAVWIMVPATAVGGVVTELAGLLAADDVVIDGGNSHYVEDPARARELGAAGIRYLDVGVSGGVFGLREGYCLMIGGDREAAERLVPVFASLAPHAAAAPEGRHGLDRPENGWLYCGKAGAGHFVKMVHNGIEYGAMAAYAEGFNLLASAGALAPAPGGETAAEDMHFEFDLAAIAELWRHGSVIRSWLLDLAARALERDAALADLEGEVGDSGEGRWTVHAAVDAAVPIPVMSAALYARFGSRGRDSFANRLLSALRREFGGHAEGS